MADPYRAPAKRVPKPLRSMAARKLIRVRWALDHMAQAGGSVPLEDLPAWLAQWAADTRNDLDIEGKR